MHVLLLGAYGFIGADVARGLIQAGHSVTGFGRSREMGMRLLPAIIWVEGDLNRLIDSENWLPLLEGVDAVVNASGALQDSGGDRLVAIQADSIVALIAACECANVSRFVQISAPGAAPDDSSPFLATKGVADQRLRRSSLGWAILRPGLVIGRNAYGGTLLLRALAAMPWLTLTVHGDRRIQTVGMGDLVEAVLASLGPDAPAAIDCDLMESDTHSLSTIITAHRAWLGIAPPLALVDFPAWTARPVMLAADLFGCLGWRSPLRSTAMAMIARDVTGDPTGGAALLGRPLGSLDLTLGRYTAGMQDRWQARLTLLLPVIISALALLWLASGIISLARFDVATKELGGTGIAGVAAQGLAIAGSLVDIVLGGAILVRRWARAATLGMVVLTLIYLAVGSALRPDLWIDPLAPLIKAVPAMILALVAAGMLDRR